MPNLGAAEILVILLVALLVLGPDKLPGAARSIGRGMSQLRRLSSGFQDEIRNALDAEDGSASGPAPSAQPKQAQQNLHPGLGPGPRLDAGAVVISDTDGATGSTRPSMDGPSESFS